MGTQVKFLSTVISKYSLLFQIALQLHQFSNLTKLGSNFGSEPTSSHMAEGRGNAQKQARQRQEQRFRQQAPAAAGVGSLTSQLSPSHLYWLLHHFHTHTLVHYLCQSVFIQIFPFLFSQPIIFFKHCSIKCNTCETVNTIWYTSTHSSKLWCILN